MAPRKPAEKVEARAPLIAVLLADSFTQRFRPMTVERPKALLALVNTPMMEYTLEWLALNRIEEVFVFCCAHADQIKKYLVESKWSQTTSGMKVTTIVSTNCLSMGEAMRLIDQKDIIKSDFVLVSGDTVSNMNLSTVIEAHKRRREHDKNAILTMVMKVVSHPAHRLRLGDTEVIVTLDPESQRLLKYQEIDNQRGSAMHKVDASFFSERDSVQVRCDLLDANICVCAPEVLMLFSDNFDYQNLRRDFVSGVLSEEELGNKLYLHIINQEYAARVHNLRSYDAISRDIVQRWCFPFVPDTNVLHRGGQLGASTYRYGRDHVYVEDQVTISRSAFLGRDCVVGSGTVISDNCRIDQTVIGRNCRIGANCRLTGSYLQDNVVVQDGAMLRSALICEGAVIKQLGVVDGAVISFGVVVGARHRVADNLRLSLCKQVIKTTSLSDDELEYTSGGGGKGLERGPDSDGYSVESSSIGSTSLEAPTSRAMRAAEAVALGRAPETKNLFDEELVGGGGAGFQWLCATDGPDGADNFSIAPPRQRGDGRLGEAEAATQPGAGGTGAADADVTGEESGSESEESEEDISDPEAIFKREVAETFLRCVKMRFDQINAVIELNGLKIAEDRTFADCARYIFTTMLSLCLPAPPKMKEEYKSLFPKVSPLAVGGPKGKLALVKAFEKHLEEWGPLLQRFLRTNDDKVELLLTFEEYCGNENVFEILGEDGSPYAEVFSQILQLLYDSDVVNEDAFLAWANEKEHADESERVFLQKASQFIEWLRTAEEADDDEEEDENDDDDED